MLLLPAIALAVIVLPAAAACGLRGGTGSPESVDTCAEAQQRVRELVDDHPGGPRTLTEEQREELQRRVEAVEARCPQETSSRFGREVLEPWTR